MEKKENLGVKIGTKEEALWTQIKEESEKIIMANKAEILIREMMLKLCEEQIAEEEKK